MDAVNFLKEEARMCKGTERCSECPIGKAKGKRKCKYWILDNPADAVAIVEKWSEEHPQKTILEDFLEKYPKAKKYSMGEPHTCMRLLYGLDSCPVSNCQDCWNRPLSEVEDE